MHIQKHVIASVIASTKSGLVRAYKDTHMVDHICSSSVNK